MRELSLVEDCLFLVRHDVPAKNFGVVNRSKCVFPRFCELFERPGQWCDEFFVRKEYIKHHVVANYGLLGLFELKDYLCETLHFLIMSVNFVLVFIS